MKMNLEMKSGPFREAEVIPYVEGTSVSLDVINVTEKNKLLGLASMIKNHIHSMPLRSTYIIRFPKISNKIVLKIQAKRSYIDREETFDDYLTILVFHAYSYILGVTSRTEEVKELVECLYEIGDCISEEVIKSITRTIE